MSQGQILKSSWAVMVHASDTNIREAYGKFKVYWVPGRPGLHKATLSLKTKKKSINDFKLILINGCLSYFSDFSRFGQLKGHYRTYVCKNICWKTVREHSCFRKFRYAECCAVINYVSSYVFIGLRLRCSLCKLAVKSNPLNCISSINSFIELKFTYAVYLFKGCSWVGFSLLRVPAINTLIQNRALMRKSVWKDLGYTKLTIVSKVDIQNFNYSWNTASK